MGLFTFNKEPIFLKDSSDAEIQLEKLKAIEPKLNAEGGKLIKRHIRNLEYGITGEKNIEYELKNSHMYMCVLHDVCLRDGDLKAQIDYLVFTKKLCFIIECKNLYGNIEIKNNGAFTRIMEYGGKRHKESIYSPITQNQHHLELLKKIWLDRKNFVGKLIGGTVFEDFYKPIIVLANPKTILNAKYAKKEVKHKVIRADQLVQYIKNIDAECKGLKYSEKKTMEWAKSFLNLHRENPIDYSKDYKKYIVNEESVNEIVNTTDFTSSTIDSSNIMEQSAIYKELVSYRLKKCHEENVKPYFIYSNNQLKDLISKMPRTKEELLTVKGFGRLKSDKYGDDIISIVCKYN